MAEKLTRWQRFKRFLKRNMTPTWAKHFSYQVASFIISVALIVGVGNYAITKSYEERNLSFMDGFTITAHTGAFSTADNSLDSVKAAIKNNVQVFEIDIRLRPSGTVVMGHDIIVTNNDGVQLTEAFELLKPTNIRLNLDIKETKALKPLYDLIIQYSMTDRVFLTGIEQSQVDAVKANCPNIDYYINCTPSRIRIFDDDYQKKLITMLQKTGAIGVNCKYTYASRTLSNLLHKNGYKLSVWTVDTERQIKRALINKPDNITTHNPDMIQDVIDNWGK